MEAARCYTIHWDGRELALGARTLIMGVLNITPDSFSDGGLFFKPDAAIAQARALVRDGADILDVGGESTRPFAHGVPAAEEIRRVVPVIEALADRIAVPISIDTTKAAVARKALAAGASLINDISALTGDAEMGVLAAEAGVPVVLMHMLGNPRTMQVDPVYNDLIADIRMYLEKAIARAEKAGIARSKIIIDPGIGFGKTANHNLQLIKSLSEFALVDVPLLVGPSRKYFIRSLLSDQPGRALTPDAPAVGNGTQAVVAACALQGAHIVRVHDVARTRQTLKIIDALKQAECSHG